MRKLWAKRGVEKMFKSKLVLSFSLVVLALLSGCMTAAQHQQSLPSTKEREMTVGIVQKEIRVGMSQTDVAVALDPPNIITRDSEGKETRIYGFRPFVCGKDS